MKTVAVLFCHPRTYYAGVPGVEVYTEARDARTFPGGMPVIAHPPCRMWSRARRPGLATCSSEMDLARWAVATVRREGGILEHPYQSRLWADQDLPREGQMDQHGFTCLVDQIWFGHRAEKATWLYVCGVNPNTLPPIPEHPAFSPRVNFNRLGRAERQLTPPAFARFLVQVARLASMQVAKPGTSGHLELEVLPPAPPSLSAAVE